MSGIPPPSQQKPNLLGSIHEGYDFCDKQRRIELARVEPA
jgi:hypothetical protein